MSIKIDKFSLFKTDPCTFEVCLDWMVVGKICTTIKSDTFSAWGHKNNLLATNCESLDEACGVIYDSL